jgi:1-acyl-sn-glycerol-3-phosphate acyltransferase
MQKSIDQYSTSYSLLKRYVIFWLRRFYITSIKGSENINPGERLILVANHQNALMDALVLLSLEKFQPVFMARSDIFANKKVAKILRFFKMLPIYRIRDGYDQLANNKEVFSQAFGVLENGNPLAIFPEGNHDDRFRLRAMKKGAARIAFTYRHHDSEKKPVKILPVGLNYSNLHQAESKLFISIGQSVDVAAFDKDFEENPAKAYNLLLKDVSDSLKAHMLHIEDETLYPTCYAVLQIFGSLAHDENQRHEKIFNSQRKIIDLMEAHWNDEDKSSFESIKLLADQMIEKLSEQNLQITDIPLVKIGDGKKLLMQTGLILSFPLYLYGWLIDFLPSLIVGKIKGKIKDQQFRSSVQFTGTILITPVLYLLYTLLFAIFSPAWWCTLMFFISLPLSFLLKVRWEQLKDKIKRLKSIAPVKDKLLQNLKNLRQLTQISFYI